MVRRQAGALIVMPDPLFFAEACAAGRAGSPLCGANYLSVPGVYREWWPDELWR